MIQTTQEYFNKTAEELSEIRNDAGYTREDCLILDAGLEVKFYEQLDNLQNDIEYWSKVYRLEVDKILKMTTGRYALILN